MGCSRALRDILGTLQPGPEKTTVLSSGPIGPKCSGKNGGVQGSVLSLVFLEKGSPENHRQKNKGFFIGGYRTANRTIPWKSGPGKTVKNSTARILARRKNKSNSQKNKESRKDRDSGIRASVPAQSGSQFLKAVFADRTIGIARFEIRIRIASQHRTIQCH